MNDKTYQDALNLLAEMRTLENRLAKILNCKATDIKKTLAAEANNRGANVAVGYDKRNSAYTWTVTTQGKDTTCDDGKAACARLRELGEEVPQTIRKGTAATLRNA